MLTQLKQPSVFVISVFVSQRYRPYSPYSIDRKELGQFYYQIYVVIFEINKDLSVSAVWKVQTLNIRQY